MSRLSLETLDPHRSDNAFDKGSKKSISNDFSHFAFRSHFSFETLDPHRSYQTMHSIRFLKRVFQMILAMNLRLKVTFVLGDIGSSQVLSGNAFNKGSKKSISNDRS